MPSTPIQFITGAAGTGKTYTVRERLKADRKWAKVCATTGVAAANLDTVTLHSLLRVFRPDDFVMRRRQIARRLDELRVRNIVVDEISMLSAEMLDALVDFLDWYNDSGDPVGLVLTGDFAQLPCVEGKMAFLAGCWPRVEVQYLTKIWRQDHAQFLQALNQCRLGNGAAAAQLLKDICEWHPARDPAFPGLCLVATKKAADSFNSVNLERLAGEYLTAPVARWGTQLNDWKDVPDRVSLKVGCRVRIRANDTKTWHYVNGDTGVLVRVATDSKGEPRDWHVQLDRTGLTWPIASVWRYNDVNEEAPGCRLRRVCLGEDEYGELQFEDQPYIGSITYLPLEPGYASTTHSAQGLTLESVQVSLADLTNWITNNLNFGHNLAYVALSRAKDPAKLRIHGTPGEFAKRVRVHPQVRQWLQSIPEA